MSINPSVRNAIYAFFRDRSKAMAAIADLKEAGFSADQIGLAMGDDLSRGATETNTAGQPIRAGLRDDVSSESRSSADRSAWEKIKDFFSGHEETYRGSEHEYDNIYSDLSQERSRYYNSGIYAGGALVTVSAPAARMDEATRILSSNGGDLRTSGFEEVSSRTSGRSISDREASDLGASNERRIQLRGEMLRAVKERVEKGEIRLRKDVISENQTINVPVTREEVIVERVDAQGTSPVSGRIGDEGEIRIPVSEEKVHVVKEPVVTGEVRVQKRTVQDNRQVSDDVRHEEVRVENEGDVRLENQDAVDTVNKPKTGKKKPAA